MLKEFVGPTQRSSKKKLKFAFSADIDGKDFGICAIGQDVKQPKTISSWRDIRNDRH